MLSKKIKMSKMGVLSESVLREFLMADKGALQSLTILCNTIKV
jgi:hypothetical protein